MITCQQVIITQCDICDEKKVETFSIASGGETKIFNPQDYDLVKLPDGRTVCSSHIEIVTGSKEEDRATDKDLKECLVVLVDTLIEAGVIDGLDGTIDHQGFSAYEFAEALLFQHNLAFTVSWRECGVLTRKDIEGRTPGTYLNILEFNKLKEECQ